MSVLEPADHLTVRIHQILVLSDRPLLGGEIHRLLPHNIHILGTNGRPLTTERRQLDAVKAALRSDHAHKLGIKNTHTPPATYEKTRGRPDKDGFWYVDAN